MASTEELPSGRFRGIYRDANGDKQHVKGTFRLKSEAKAAANDAESIARRQSALKAGTLSAKITWDQWWEVLAADRVFESDSDATERSLVTKHISPQWGETELNRIGRIGVQSWVNSLQRQRTPKGTPYEASYVRKIYGLFAVTINAAINADPPVLGVSPLRGIQLPMVRKKPKTFIPVADVPTLTDRQKGGLRADYADALEWMLETGCRPGEVCGLHDDQVDVAARLLLVRTVYVRRQKRMRDHPKDEDVRHVPLSTAALEIYQRRTEGRDMSRPCGVEHFGGRCRAGLVFHTERGLTMNPDSLRQAFIHAAERVKLTPRSPYAGRRGFATRIARGGMDLFEMMDLMGWSDPKLAREYVQESAGARERLMAALGDPEASKLRVVGQESGRGTFRGTDVSQQPTEGERKPKRRESG
ncbi:MAG TPA: tyrosine-type recombinase/integrase [Pseudonocardiaceae bacterium]|jgi:integrase|nr:tyrosine-type recombinase/integrase [Pseudonocardiaceae bacterium]